MGFRVSGLGFGGSGAPRLGFGRLGSRAKGFGLGGPEPRMYDVPTDLLRPGPRLRRHHAEASFLKRVLRLLPEP